MIMQRSILIMYLIYVVPIKALRTVSLSSNPNSDPSYQDQEAVTHLMQCDILPRTAGFAVDLGGGIRDSDPVFPLFDKGWAGWMVDGDEKQRWKMNQKFPSDKIKKVVHFVYPHNIVQLLKEDGVPGAIDFMKVDIDGFDCDTMNAALEYVRPKAVIMEVNVKFPPSIFMSLRHNNQSYNSEKRDLFYGCSLAYQAEILMKPHGYVLVQMDQNNALYVEKQAFTDKLDCLKKQWPNVGQESLQSIFEMGYVKKGIPKYDRGTIDSWRTLQAEEVMPAIKDYSCKHGVSQDHLEVDIWRNGTDPSKFTTISNGGKFHFTEKKKKKKSKFHFAEVQCGK